MSEILTQNLGMKCVVAKFVLWLLLPEQKEHCATVANKLIETYEPDFLKKGITLKGTKESYVQCFLYLPQEMSLFFHSV